MNTKIIILVELSSVDRYVHQSPEKNMPGPMKVFMVCS